MPFCTSCGSAISQEAKACFGCGAEIRIEGQLQPQIALAGDTLYRVAYANGQNAGPFTEAAIKDLIMGIALTPLFGIGIPIFIAGYILRWGGKGKAGYRCPGCNFAS